MKVRIEKGDSQMNILSSIDLVEEAEFDGCPGWKSPDECPHDGRLDPDSKACKECEEDALKALREIT